MKVDGGINKRERMIFKRKKNVGVYMDKYHKPSSFNPV